MQHKMSGKRSAEAQTYRTLYGTKHWKTLRRQALTRDEYRCQHSGCGAHLQAGRDHPRSAVVHHLKPHKGSLELFFVLDNLSRFVGRATVVTFKAKRHWDTTAQLETMAGLSIQSILVCFKNALGT